MFPSKKYCWRFKQGAFRKFSPPSWMHEQISNDFAPFYARGITLDGIEEVYLKTLQVYKTLELSYNLLRLRCIDGKVYMKGENVAIARLFNTLSKWRALPNIDIVMTTNDSSSIDHVEPLFWSGYDAPLLARDKEDKDVGVVLVPDDLSMINSNRLIKEIKNADFPWKLKQNKAIWRGAPSDLGFYLPANYPNDFICHEYTQRPRYKACELSLRYDSLLDARFNKIDIYEPLQELTCHLLGSYLNYEEQLKYKYLLCLDGVASTYPGFLWRLLSKSLCLKQESRHIQWFYRAISPYTHYLPIKNDLSDLIDQIQWAIENDLSCRQMAESSYLFAKNYLTSEKMLYYLYLVLREYERLQQFNKEDLLKNLSTWKRID